MVNSVNSQGLSVRLEEDNLKQVLEVLHTKGEFKMILAHLRALKADFEMQKGHLDVALDPQTLYAQYLQADGRVAAMETVLTVLEGRDV